MYLYAVLLFLLNLSRCFDQGFWADEAYSILLVQNSLPDILSGTAADVHPQLYYLWLKVFDVLLGGAGWHLATLMTYGVILVVGVTWVRKCFGYGSAALFLTLCSFLEHAVTYNVEVRMYSMAELFVLLSFLSLYHVLRSHRWRGRCRESIGSLPSRPGGSVWRIFSPDVSASYYCACMW